MVKKISSEDEISKYSSISLNLKHKIEDCLLLPTPRNLKWVDRNGIPHKKEQCLNNWIAISSWISKVDVKKDSEGTDFKIEFVFKFNSELYLLKIEVGYDRTHWPMGFPEHCEWFSNTMQVGNTCTLLIKNELTQIKNSIEVQIFGQLEPFLTKEEKILWAAL